VSSSGSEPAEDPNDGAHSSFSLSISLTVGYDRHRAKLATKFESNVVALGLLFGGSALVLIFVWELLQRFLIG
jgi:hypothetical protein